MLPSHCLERTGEDDEGGCGGATVEGGGAGAGAGPGSGYDASAPTSGASSPFNAVTTTPYADSSSSARLTNDVSCVAAAVFAANITSDMRKAACRTAMSSTAPASPVYLHKLAATTTTSHAYFLPAQSRHTEKYLKHTCSSDCSRRQLATPRERRCALCLKPWRRGMNATANNTRLSGLSPP